MLRKILIFGVIAGLIVGLSSFTITVVFAGEPPPLEYGMVIGYTTMLVALSFVFVGIKRHRDLDLGGAIRFWPALGMGLAISFIASLFYVLAWEAALAVTFKAQYADPLFRLPMTFAEIFPVGVLVSAISAGLLRNHRFLAARGTGTGGRLQAAAR